MYSKVHKCRVLYTNVQHCTQMYNTVQNALHSTGFCQPVIREVADTRSQINQEDLFGLAWVWSGSGRVPTVKVWEGQGETCPIHSAESLSLAISSPHCQLQGGSSLHCQSQERANCQPSHHVTTVMPPYNDNIITLLPGPASLAS